MFHTKILKGKFIIFDLHIRIKMQSRQKNYISENTIDFIIEQYWCCNAIEKRLMLPYNSTNCIMIFTNFWINIYPIHYLRYVIRLDLKKFLIIISFNLGVNYISLPAVLFPNLELYDIPNDI